MKIAVQLKFDPGWHGFEKVLIFSGLLCLSSTLSFSFFSFSKTYTDNVPATNIHVQTTTLQKKDQFKSKCDPQHLSQDETTCATPLISSLLREVLVFPVLTRCLLFQLRARSSKICFIWEQSAAQCCDKTAQWLTKMPPLITRCL